MAGRDRFVGWGGEPAVEYEDGGKDNEGRVGDVVAAVEPHDLGNGAEVREDDDGGRRAGED